MSATIACPRCGTDLPVVLQDADEGQASLIALVSDHECTRFLVAEYWEDSEITARWTSDVPQKTGPLDARPQPFGRCHLRLVAAQRRERLDLQVGDPR